ncbi:MULTISPECIES: biotin--[acetyl-CoA-carboxylase] ligase [Hoeflea]|uniref:biotin--[biotin carboxyl-carrier protein] ligase n=1 Tax=Hoeflea alexandrii TaxID=288436 RepID=A0ABT1CRL0_9HYPH|nr:MULTISPECIES: biotin--[acetyl-CoA-carboxylase] ligase [Hoeflea]MCO6408006.1 biotin--[acetyl-CoA-carboxylase] ligase [Hoeflea alexandrii]MCY0153647.1 biotin--[acetyl-CoA-carboxylase] ligase [Hoeflea alexandrii]VVT11987.1 Biotin--(acetyl-CoA-carboxylase) ligase [Hoeflea sp. EC-HK425]|tara:strand:- start:506 stop:1249 length:744 start_codon:yes stop_codon:yes gene_type:complete
MRGPDFRHIELGDVASTNLECMDRARSGDEGNLWITAVRQTGGRARRGRSWVSEPGNLYSSLLLIDPAPWAALASLPLAVTVAVEAAVSSALPAEAAKALRIKWPNDLLIGGRKTSGILIEAEQMPDGRRAVVIGCGINVAHRPEAGLYPTTCLAEQGSAVTPQDLFAQLVVTMDSVLSLWDQGRGVAAIRDAWIERAQGIGEPVTVNLPDRQISGLFDGIDIEGRLMLALPDGNRQTIASGDVFFS